MDMNPASFQAGAASAYRQLIDIGIALSVERDSAKLMERILLEAKAFTNADAGTLYLNNEDKELTFQIVRNDTLNIALGGTTGDAMTFRPVPLFTESGAPNCTTWPPAVQSRDASSTFTTRTRTRTSGTSQAPSASTRPRAITRSFPDGAAQEP